MEITLKNAWELRDEVVKRCKEKQGACKPELKRLIEVKTEDSFFNATEMLQYYCELTGSKKRFKDFWENQNTSEFMEALKQEILNGHNSPHLEIVETTRGLLKNPIILI
jgi:hypothetical protein